MSFLTDLIAKETAAKESIRVDPYVDKKGNKDWCMERRKPSNTPVPQPRIAPSISDIPKDEDLFELTPPPELPASNTSTEAEFYRLMDQLADLASDDTFREHFIRGIARVLNSKLSQAALRLKIQKIEKAGVYQRVAIQELYYLIAKSPLPEMDPANVGKSVIKLTATSPERTKKTEEEKFTDKYTKMGFSGLKIKELWLTLQAAKAKG